MLIRILHLKISHMNICCRCLHIVNKLVEIQNEPRDLLKMCINVDKYADSQFRI